MPQQFSLILQSREERTRLRIEFSKAGKISVSLSLNISGIPKSNDLTKKFFEQILSELEIFLASERISLSSVDKIQFEDSAGDFYINTVENQNIDSLKIKKITELFEEKHSVGRLIDVDVFDIDSKPVSYGKAKTCFFCGNFSAVECMRTQRHTYEELREKIFSKMEFYLSEKRKDSAIKKISSLAVKSILYEISLTPKPGLVNFENSGAHTDMNFFTFLDSSAVLAVYFENFAKAGYEFSENPDTALPEIRLIGLNLEKEMFSATNRINTQKGAIFLMGLSIFSMSYVFSRNENPTLNQLRNVVREICKNLVVDELKTNRIEKKTHGEICFEKYGNAGAGARQEAESGFPSVFEYALPVFRKYFPFSDKFNKEKINFALQKVLLTLISVNNDSNILYRKGTETAENLKQKARICLETDSDEKYKELCEFCIHENISPGGSADLLAVTIFLGNIEKYVLIVNDLQ